MKVHGNDVLVQIDEGGGYVPYACAVSIDLETNRDMIETAEEGNNGWSTYVPGKQSFGGTMNGFTSLDETNQFSLNGLRRLQKQGTKIKIIFSYSDGTTSIYYEGFAFINNVKDSTQFSGFNNFEVSITGSGELVASTGSTPTPPTPVIYIYEFGSVNFDTTDESQFIDRDDRINQILAAIQGQAGQTNTADENDNITVQFTAGFEIKYIKVPDSVPDFLRWSEQGNFFNQNVSFGTVFVKKNDSGFNYYFTEYDTDFTNKIIFSR